MSKPDITGRVTKWAMEIAEYNLEIRPRKVKKGQVLADFLNEYTAIGIKNPRSKVTEVKSEWHMHIDGARNRNRARIEIILDNGEGVTLKYAL